MTNAEDRAFPNRLTSGLTKREYFAAMAMQGFLSSCSSVSVPDAEMIAIESVKYADALIKELNNEKKDK